MKATFKRVSTPSTTSDDEKEPLRTQWLWYWADNGYVWKLFAIGQEVKYYTNSGWSTRTEKWRSQVQERWVRCFRGNLGFLIKREKKNCRNPGGIPKVETLKCEISKT